MFFEGVRKITTTINREDYEYFKKHGLKFAHAIRAFARDHRVNIEDPEAQPSSREIVQQRDRVVEHRNKILNAIKKELGEKKFLEFIQKI